MTANEKKTLVSQATKLYTLGLKVEKCRNKLAKLVAKKVPYTSLQMRTALMEFMVVNEEWSQLEQEHLAYRATMTGSEEIA